MIPIRVNDIKQYAYCLRVVFYQYCMPVNKKTTWKMEQGKIAEGRIDELEKRRKLREYRLAEGTRKFHVWVNSKRLGLSGKLDLLIDSPEGLFPVDFKMTTGTPHRNHVMQLCGYARLLEDCYQREVTKGFVYLIPKNDAVVFDLTEERKKEADELIREIRQMIESQHMPAPTPVRTGARIVSLGIIVAIFCRGLSQTYACLEQKVSLRKKVWMTRLEALVFSGFS